MAGRRKSGAPFRLDGISYLPSWRPKPHIMPKILVLPFMLQHAEGPYLDELRAVGLEAVYPGRGVSLNTPELLLSHLKGIEGVIAGMEPFTPEVLAQSHVRAIARMGVGHDAIDVPAATAQGIAVTITPGTNEISVAEQTLALILGVMRGFPLRDRQVRRGEWIRQDLPRLAGQTLGLIGLGRIGKAVVPRAQGLGMHVIAHDPVGDAAWAEQNGVTLHSLSDLLAAADVVSLHLPCTAETQNLINARTLSQMKRGSVLINTSRGGLVDEEALVSALQLGHLAAAGLDVFQQEPLPLESPLLQLENVLLSPHMGGLDEQSVIDMSQLAARCIARLYRGEWPEGCVVNEELRAGWRW